ncbi:MAG: FliM/FliN family flagellar motor C-terminal domain-containing protein [Pseudomonadota bacterium]
MSAVLRKKLESSGGLPPKVLQNRTFWMNLESVIAGWLNETLGGDNQIRLQSREVCRGAALADDLFGAYLYGFQHDTQDFIVAVSVDNVIAARFAADKMQQDPAVLAEAPQLFLQLLLEAPAAKLSGSVATAFDMVGEEGELPDATAFESLDVEGNCLVVYYLCDFDGQAVRIGVALKLDKVIAIAIGGEDGIANTPGEEAGKAPNLSEPRVQNSTVELKIVIDRVPMSIADCARLQAGDVLSLPGTDRSKLKVAAKTIDGAVDIAAGELGVWKHQRAVRLKSEIDPDFIREVAAS